MGVSEPDQVIETIARRRELFAVLEDGPHRKPALVSKLSVSRSTVDRVIRDLEAAGLVSRERGRVELSLAGRLAFREFERYRAGLAGLTEAWGMLEAVSADADLDLDLFRGAEIVQPERHAPHQPVEAVKSFLGGADLIRGAASAVLPEYVELYTRQIVDHGTAVHLVIPTPVLDALVADYGQELEAALETGRLYLLEIDEDPPFSTIVAHKPDPTVGVVVYGSSGTAGFIRNDAPGAVAWARGWLEDWERRATPIAEPRDLGQ